MLNPFKCKLLISLFLIGFNAAAAVFAGTVDPQVCFTPQQDCTRLLIATIAEAKKSIYVQAYSFTSFRIAKALASAQLRGIKVQIILDKSNFPAGQRSMANYFNRYAIPLWQDKNLNIAHNKVMIIDEAIVETGSFNYTVSAQKYNAENMLIIREPNLARHYLQNWYARQQEAVRMQYIGHHWRQER